MPARPAAFTWVGLYEVGERNPQFDLLTSEGAQFRAGPRQIVEVHVSCLDCSAFFFPEWQEGILDH